MAKKKNQPIGSQLPPVTVEYDYGTKGERRTKYFEDANEAKKFYAAKEKAGKKPKVLKPSGSSVVATTGEAPTSEKALPERKPVEKPKTPGVRPSVTRPYLAGVIIAKHGLAAGVTHAMVAELDEAYGKANPTESLFCLKNAWHACRAFSGTAE